MNTNNSNIINGYDLVQVKNTLPQIIQCSTRYKELSQLFSQTEYQETLLDIIITTLKRIRRYQSSKVIDLARLVKLLYGIQNMILSKSNIMGRPNLIFHTEKRPGYYSILLTRNWLQYIHLRK